MNLLRLNQRQTERCDSMTDLMPFLLKEQRFWKPNRYSKGNLTAEILLVTKKKYDKKGQYNKFKTKINK